MMSAGRDNCAGKVSQVCLFGSDVKAATPRKPDRLQCVTKVEFGRPNPNLRAVNLPDPGIKHLKRRPVPVQS